MKKILAICLALVMLVASASALADTQYFLSLDGAVLSQDGEAIMDLSKIGLALDLRPFADQAALRLTLGASNFSYDLTVRAEDDAHLLIDSSILSAAYRFDLSEDGAALLRALDKAKADPAAGIDRLFGQLQGDEAQTSVAQTTKEGVSGTSTQVILGSGDERVRLEVFVDDANTMRLLTLETELDQLADVPGAKASSMQIAYRGTIEADQPGTWMESGTATITLAPYEIALRVAVTSHENAEPLASPVDPIHDYDNMSRTQQEQLREEIIRGAMKVAGALLQAAPDLSTAVSAIMKMV